MKKIFIVLLTLAMIFSMVACGSSNGYDTSTQNQSSSSIEADPDSSLESVDSQSQNSSENSSEVVDIQNENNDSEGTGSQNEGESTEPVENSTSEQGSNILVVYFSRVGNTEWEDGVDAVTSASINATNGEFVGNAELLAQMAQEVTGGDLFLIQTAETYPSDYRETTDVAAEEQDNNARPQLSSHVDNMDQYDTIVLIYPNWWGTLPQPLFTFLEEYDFSGKTILPLCTHGGSRMGRSESDIVSICPDATLLEGLAVSGSDAASAQSDVEKWINNSGILE